MVRFNILQGPMRAPGFWYDEPGSRGVRSAVLSPLGWLYGCATARRVSRGASFTANVPVICVGNINAGGTGKTPTVIALTEHLKARGQRVIIVSRGYGGALNGPVLVEPTHHSSDAVGDEPLLMAAFARVVVAKDRVAGARLAGDLGADVIVLDDGFQDPSLHKDLSLVVVDGRRGFGNSRCIPAGPLREPVAQGMKRADAVIVLGEADAQARFDRLWPHDGSVALVRAELRPLRTGMRFEVGRYLAFAGIGDPEKFFRTLRASGADVVREVALADHQAITPPLMKRLQSQANSLSAQLVCTEKDAVRLPMEFRSKVLSFPVRLHLDWAPLEGAFAQLGLGSPPSHL